MPAASIRDSILAMKAVAGMANPLLEARVVRTGTRLAFRHGGAMVDPIRRQLLFDFERTAGARSRLRALAGPRRCRIPGSRCSERHSGALPGRGAGRGGGRKACAPSRSTRRFSSIDPDYAPACINLGTLLFHLRQFGRAEELYRRATESDPGYVLAYFDLGNVLDELERLDESIAAYRKAVALSPRYADAHYNLALAYERSEQSRARPAPLAGLCQARQSRSLGRPRPRPDSQAARAAKSSPSPRAPTASLPRRKGTAELALV